MSCVSVYSTRIDTHALATGCFISPPVIKAYSHRACDKKLEFPACDKKKPCHEVSHPTAALFVLSTRKRPGKQYTQKVSFTATIGGPRESVQKCTHCVQYINVKDSNKHCTRVADNFDVLPTMVNDKKVCFIFRCS